VIDARLASRHSFPSFLFCFGVLFVQCRVLFPLRAGSSFIAGCIAIAFSNTSVHAQTPTPPEGESVSVTLNAVTSSGIGEPVARAELVQAPEGLQIVIVGTRLPVGPHGFHVHELGNCGPKEKDGKMEAAGAAGGHYDPEKTGKHAGPDRGGHKGDLPLLNITADGDQQRSAFVVRGLTLAEIRGRSLMIHAGGDTYSDEPPMGGGGARIACGVIP
jgi:Cu-Zn family superoxide dismutase